MRDIKEMARQVKMPYDYITGEPINIEKLEAFAELVRADALAARKKREFVGLTDEEFQMIYEMGRTPAGMMEMVEAKLKEKNT